MLHETDSDAVSFGSGGAHATETRAAVAEDDERLLDLLTRWDELYRRHEIATPETLGVDDSLLRAVLLERIEERKRLYAFLRLSKLAKDENSGGRRAASDVGNALDADDDDRVGPSQRIGRYLVLEKLDEGHQGQVFRVVHPALGKEFVLKLAARPVEMDNAWRERLIAEGRLLAECDHPNLVRVVDLDFHEGRPFVVMEHVRGVNLEQFVKQHRPGPRACTRLVAELARAVSYVNARGIVHQDIKPKNVLIDEQGCPRLIDFGLARHRDAWSGEGPSTIGGTAAYMSPEQALGKNEEIGPRTDVFGLGGVLYYLLTRQPVYQSPSQLAALERAMRGEQVAPRLVALGTPRSLERICLKALDADPDRRYQTAGDLERALRRYLRRPKMLAIGMAVVLAIVTSGLFAVRFRSPVARSGEREPSGEPRSTPGTDLPSSPPIVGRIGNPPYRPTSPGTVVPVLPQAAVRIDSFELKHFRGDKPPKALGVIGESSVPILFDDDVRVHASFSTPVYCYLIALNPDGKVQSCSPATPHETPMQVEDLSYPLGNLYFPLNDGTGLQAFVLLVSREPLPSFAEWEGNRTLRWETVQADGAGVWGFNGNFIEPLTDGWRGPPRSHDGAPRSFQDLCDWVKQLPGVDARRAIVFPVMKRGIDRSPQ